jgi:phytoene dehydrogenase-like protein
MYDTLIIGAGMSGLAAGIRLAYYDQRVCILERHTTIGGLNSFYRLNGRDFDVGLHAVTNFSPQGAKRGPLARLLRQLRFRWEDFALRPQVGSAICFPGVTLEFDNDFERFEAAVAAVFPRQIDGFRRLVAQIADYDDLELESAGRSAREVVAACIADPLLAEMLLCPLMFYGNAREHDMEWGQFCILFRSIYMEGLARPWAGIRLILKNLVRKYKSLGGELRLRAGVSRLLVEGDRVTGVVLDDGTRLEARRVLSSAGWCETMRLCENVATNPASGGRQPPGNSADADRSALPGGLRPPLANSLANSLPEARPPGRLSFFETISLLDTQPRAIGCDRTTVFFNTADRFHWERPSGLVDARSGVICSPNNFLYEEPLAEGCLRVTCLANYDRWHELPEEDYRRQKLRWYDEVVDTATRFVPDFRSHVVATDMFTPTTIHRFTGHENGAVYGAPRKQYDGLTHLENLFICGTDQGLVGIIGAIVSGITMANRHLLNVRD